MLIIFTRVIFLRHQKVQTKNKIQDVRVQSYSAIFHFVGVYASMCTLVTIKICVLYLCRKKIWANYKQALVIFRHTQMVNHKRMGHSKCQCEIVWHFAMYRRANYKPRTVIIPNYKYIHFVTKSYNAKHTLVRFILPSRLNICAKENMMRRKLLR